MALSPGTRIDVYTLLAPLGSGGMGEVYKARDERLNRLVALKVLPEGLASDARALARFQREANLLARLSHPNIVAIFDVGQGEGSPFLVTELLEGQTLDALIQRGPMAEERARALAMQIAEGLDAAHARGVVHRDLKPSNVFVQKADRVKLLDFGLAKDLRLDLDESGTAIRLDATREGAVLGTVGYMAPEQVRGEGADARSDLFALGVLLLELLTGEQAFQGDSAVDVLHAILRTDPLEGRVVPEALRPVLARLLAKDPEQRFQTAKDVAFVLGSPLPAPKARRHRAGLLVACGLSLLVGGLGAGLWIHHRRPPMPRFRKLTVTPLTVTGTAFLDEDRVVFSGEDDNGQEDVYLVDLRQPDPPKPLGILHAGVLSANPAGEVALILHPPGQVRGTLAILPSPGHAPQHIQEQVDWAGWGPDGRDLIVHRFLRGDVNAQVIEYRGRTLFKAPFGEMTIGGRVLSPDRRRLAMACQEHTGWLIRIVDVITGAQFKIPMPQDPVSSAFAFEWVGERLVAVGTEGGGAKVHTLVPDAPWQDHPFPMPALRALLGASRGGRLLLSDMTMEIGSRWQRPGAPTRWLREEGTSLSAQGTFLATTPISWVGPRSFMEGARIWQWESPLPKLAKDVYVRCSHDAVPWHLASSWNPTGRFLLLPQGLGTPKTLPGDWDPNPNLHPSAWRHGFLLPGHRRDTGEKGTWFLEPENLTLTRLTDRILIAPASPDGRWAFEDIGKVVGKRQYRLVSVPEGKPTTCVLPPGHVPLAWKADSMGFWFTGRSWEAGGMGAYPVPIDFWSLGQAKPRKDKDLGGPGRGSAFCMDLLMSSRGDVVDTYWRSRTGHLYLAEGLFSR